MAESQVTLRVQAEKPRAKGEADDDAADLSQAPIFADLAAESKDELDHVMVERVAPVHEGQLGRFEPDVTEADIYERHGGGKYRCQGRTKGSRPIKGAHTTLILAGEPLLRSKLARRTYAAMTGKDEDAAPAAPVSTMQDMLAMLEQTRATADAERERRAEQEEQRHNRELARIKAEAEARAAERAAEDERKRKDEEARDERRRRDEEDRRKRDKEEAAEREIARKRDDEERRAREKKEDEERRQRDREWQVTLAQMNKGAAAVDPITLFTQGIALAQKLGGGAAAAAGAIDDPLTALASNLPATVTELGKLWRGGAGGAPGSDPNDLTLQGQLGELGNRAVKHLQAQGLDPAAVLVNAFNLMLTMRGPGAQAQPAAPAAAGPAPPRRGPGGRPMPPRAPAAAPSSPNGAQPVNAAAAKDGFVPTPGGEAAPG